MPAHRRHAALPWSAEEQDVAVRVANLEPATRTRCTSTASPPGWRSHFRPPTCRGTFARCTFAIPMATSSASAGDSRPKSRNGWPAGQDQALKQDRSSVFLDGGRERIPARHLGQNAFTAVQFRLQFLPGRVVLVRACIFYGHARSSPRRSDQSISKQLTPFESLPATRPATE